MAKSSVRAILFFIALCAIYKHIYAWFLLVLSGFLEIGLFGAYIIPFTCIALVQSM